MSNLDDINKLMKDMMGNFPFDTVGVEKTFKSSALLNEKLANVALEAASKSTEISTDGQKILLVNCKLFHQQGRTSKLCRSYDRICFKSSGIGIRKCDRFYRDSKKGTNGNC